MFIYIADFEKISYEYKVQVVNLMDQIFKKFDTLCIKNGVQKIETVGNTYLCACGEEIDDKIISEDKRNINITQR